MKNLLPKLLLALLCSFFLNTQAQPNTSEDSRVKESVQAWMKKNSIPGVAVEVYKNGVPHSYSFGLANKEQKIPVTQKTIFEVGSITKLFTSILLAEEIVTHNVDLNTSVRQYLPDLDSSLRTITFKNLATHTTGLASNFPDDVKTRSALKDYLQTWKPTHEIGTEWQYSNINTGLLGFSLEAVNHRNLNQLYRERILLPLGMEPIGITVPKKYQRYYAQGYAKNGQPIFDNSKNWLFPAAGAMKVSANDMLLFLKAALGMPQGPTTVRDAIRFSQKTFVSTAEMQQGLGWVINLEAEKNRVKLLNSQKDTLFGPLPATQLDSKRQLLHDDALIEKTGTTKGFRAYIGLIRQQQSGVVILANRYISSGEITKIGREILLK